MIELEHLKLNTFNPRVKDNLPIHPPIPAQLGKHFSPTRRTTSQTRSSPLLASAPHPLVSRRLLEGVAGGSWAKRPVTKLTQVIEGESTGRRTLDWVFKIHFFI